MQRSLPYCLIRLKLYVKWGVTVKPTVTIIEFYLEHLLQIFDAKLMEIP